VEVPVGRTVHNAVQLQQCGNQ